jgi:hypothetical protein
MMNFTMNGNKMILISVSIVLATMLLSSGNALNLSFAQSNTLSQSNTIGQGNDSGEDQTNTGGDNSNSDRQNYDDFQNCLENEAGSSGFATEDQIRDCFAPIYIGGSDNDDSSSDNDDSSSDDSN